MYEDAKYPDPRNPVPPHPQEETRQASCNMRALTSVEMHEIEQKSAQEVQMYVRSFLYFPTPQNYQFVQEASARYMTAWMNGRKRVLTD